MSVKIDKDYSGNIQLSIHGWIIEPQVAKRMRPVLIRHISEMSAAIEMAAGKEVMEVQREKTIKERRAVFVLMERFDGIRADTDESNSVLSWLGDTAMRLSKDDEKRLHAALVWYRNSNAEDSEEFSNIEHLINLLEQQLNN